MASTCCRTKGRRSIDRTLLGKIWSRNPISKLNVDAFTRTIAQSLHAIHVAELADNDGCDC